MSSFDSPKSEDLSKLLELLDPPRRIQSNPLYMVSIGIQKLYKNIDKSIEPSTPLLDRYQLETLLGTGNFSNVYRGTVPVITSTYALKTIFPEVTMLGLRELVFLRHLNSRIPSRSHFFVKVCDAFVSNEQLSLVFPCYDGTLIDYIVKNPVAAQSESQQSLTPINSRSKVILQPKGKRALPYSPKDSIDSSLPSADIPSLSPLFLENIRLLASKLFAALWILKSEGIVHADIKPENIFVSSSGMSALPLSQVLNCSTPSSFSNRKHSKTEKVCLDLGTENRRIDFHLADFGNAFLLSESMKFYREFNIQSMPYRSPEILCGIPFNHQIDIWSIGIVLLEICMGRTLFSCETREELFVAQCQYLSPPSATRFAGGKYSRDLFSLVASQSLVPISFPDHFRTIYNLLIPPMSDRTTLSAIYPTDLIHLIASLTYPDPDLRLNIQDAIQHTFVASSIAIPMTLWNVGGHKPKGRKNKNSSSIETLRTTRVASVAIHHTSSSNGYHSSKAEMKEKYALNW